MGNAYPKGVTRPLGEATLANTINYLTHAKMFIGVGSGLSWLAWAVGTPVTLISGFSSPTSEMQDPNVIRIFNSGSCNSCFNKHRLDAGDWNWCPEHEDTPRHFECHKVITSDKVLKLIDNEIGKL